MPRPTLPVRVCAGLFVSAVMAAGVGIGTPAAPGAAAAGVPTGPVTGVPTGPVTGGPGSTAGVPTAGSPTSGAATSAATVEEDESPLQVTIDAMTPGAVPEKGAIRISGVVTNTDDQTWSDVRMFPFAGSDAPMTTSAELEIAADTATTAVVGPRITDVMDVVGDLEPGESATYRIRLPRRLLDLTVPGIYWFGVHALGQDEAGTRDVVSDGRARTFLPHLPDPGAVTPTAIVVPLRAEIDHTRRGAVAHTGRWRRALERGSLRRLLDFGSAAAGRPLSWVVDPALFDVVDRLRRGNPVRSVSPTISAEDGAEEQQPEPEPSEDAVADTPLGRAADSWLTDARAALRNEDVLTLPYGDLDVAAAAEHDPTRYAAARAQEGRLAQEWGLTTRPVVNAPSGYLDEAGFPLIDDNALTLLTDRAFPPEQFPDGAPSVVTVDGRRAAVTSYAAASGGPGPDARRSAVALRQRVLSEAAARVLEAGADAPRPLLVKLPSGARGEPEEFWEGLDQPWVDLATADQVAGGAATPVTQDELTYPQRHVGVELDGEAFDAADAITDGAPVLQDLLTLNDTIADRLTVEALTGLGHRHRQDQADTVDRLREIDGWTQRRLAGITVLAPPGVTLASGSGEFAVTLRNELDQPVTVGVRGESPGATVDPIEPRVVPPDSRTTVFLTAHATDSGVHNVDLALVTAGGADLGVGTIVPVRSGQASVVIWWILGTGAGLLVLALAIRVVRRSRGVSTGSTTDDDTTGGDDDGPIDGDGAAP